MVDSLLSARGLNKQFRSGNEPVPAGIDHQRPRCQHRRHLPQPLAAARPDDDGAICDAGQQQQLSEASVVAYALEDAEAGSP